jgi:serpin B
VGLITQFPGSATQSVEVLKSSVARNTAPTTGDLGELVRGNTTFAVDMYKSVASSNDNIVFSPYSISVDFGMCYAGAKNTTDTEIANTMHFTLGQSRLHNAFNALDLQLAKPGTVMSSSSTGQQFTIRIANSIWGQKNFAFLQSYLDTLAINYGAGLNILDFAANPESSRVTINTWVSDQTEQKIKDLLPPGSITDMTRLVLTNAIYFKASWYYPFNAVNTVPGTFTLLDGSTTTAQMMNQTNPTSTGYEVAGEYQAVSLGYYGSKFSMVIILPEQGKFKTYESSLTVDSITSIFGSLVTRQVKLTLPKFSFEWSSSLKTLLQNLGMKVPFTLGTADFTGITTASQLFISDAIHKAYIGVNEQGTEAAAATGIILAGSIPTPMTMNVNRPFIFIIRENSSGTVLFIGRVLKP